LLYLRIGAIKSQQQQNGGLAAENIEFSANSDENERFVSFWSAKNDGDREE
jgi:hypothetical protein